MKRYLLISIIFSSICICSFSQSYSDGPISVDVKLREVQGNFAATDESLLGIGFAPDELTFYIWAQDNLLTYPWTGGTCLQDNNFTPTVGGSNSIDFNTIFANFSFPSTTVPQYLDFKIDTWEDDLPSDNLLGFCNTGTACTWNDMECCGIYLWGLCIGIETGDDYRCDANPFYQGLTYRSGPPCQWYSHGYINGSGCVNPSSQSGAPNTNGYYKPHIETYWRYTRGTSFANAIDLGTLTMGTPMTHFNSNECYTDYYTPSTGNDVIYSFNVTNPTGVNISLCGMNGAQFDSYLYLVKDTTVIALSENNDYCSNQSELATALCETGIYYVVVDATSPSELGTFTLTITEDPSNSFSATNVVTDVSCNAGNDGKINSIISGGFSPYSFSWFDANMIVLSSNPPSFFMEDSLENLSAANYILQVTDNNNCILIDTITVNEPDPLSFVTSPISTSCNGVSDGQVNVVVSGGTQNYSYSWNTNPVQNNANAVFLPAGTYLLTVTDANNCIDTISETITEPLPVPVSISVPSTTVCVGSSVNLQATGALNYSWSPPVWLNSTTSANVISTPNSSITYVLLGTDLNGCTNTDTVDIQVVQSLMMSSNPPSPEVCEGENINVSVSGALSYSWFPPNGLNTTNSSSVIASPLNTTNYMVIGTDNFGCTDTIYINIDVLSKPSVSVTNNPSICEGESVPLLANGANNYNWYPSSGLNSVIGNTVTANPLTSTSYSVIGTSNNGCSDTIYTVVSVNPNPILSTQNSNVDICLGDTAILFVNGALNYIWNPILGLSSANSDTVLAYPVNNIAYSIVGMDSLGCTSSTSIVINVNPFPIIDVTAPKPEICIGESILLTATGGIQYSWNPVSSLSSNTGNVVSANPIINTTYMVVGTDANSCSSWDTLSIIVNPLPILSVNNVTSTICEGENISLIVAGANTYVWSPSLGLNTSLGNSVVANPINTTNYIITGTDLNGCQDVVLSSVNVNPSPNLSLNPDNASICMGSALQIEVFGAINYVWNPSFGLNTTTSNIVQANPASDVIYTVVGTDINSCKDSIEFQLIVGVPPTVFVSPLSSTICEGESVTLTANGANNYSWSPSTSLSSNIGVSVVSTPQNTTDYKVIGTDLIGCTDTTNVVVSVIPLPTATIVSGGGTICSGDSAAIIVDVSGNPDWNLTYSVDGAISNITSSNNPIVILSDKEGIYTIPYILDANGCSNTGTGSEIVDVINRPQASFNFYPDSPNMLNPEVSFSNTSIFANTYLWQFGDNTPNSTEFNPTHIYQEDDIYQIVLLAENGPCTDTAFSNITINPYYALYVPNTFTPNDDGRNDMFEPKGVGIESFEIYIFNRWGEELFYSDNIDVCWDGGSEVASVYTYVINVVDKLGTFHKRTGEVLIE